MAYAVAVMCHQELRPGAPGVYADDVDASQAEPVEDFDEQPGEPGGGETGVRVQRNLVRAQRQFRQHASAAPDGAWTAPKPSSPSAVISNGDFEEHWRFHLEREHQRLYPGIKQGQYTLSA